MYISTYYVVMKTFRMTPFSINYDLSIILLIKYRYRYIDRYI